MSREELTINEKGVMIVRDVSLLTGCINSRRHPSLLLSALLLMSIMYSLKPP
jgi:hypothetical protein